jgi:hypothetical protein
MGNTSKNPKKIQWYKAEKKKKKKKTEAIQDKKINHGKKNNHPAPRIKKPLPHEIRADQPPTYAIKWSIAWHAIRRPRSEGRDDQDGQEALPDETGPH